MWFLYQPRVYQLFFIDNHTVYAVASIMLYSPVRIIVPHRFFEEPISANMMRHYSFKRKLRSIFYAELFLFIFLRINSSPMLILLIQKLASPAGPSHLLGFTAIRSLDPGVFPAMLNAVLLSPPSPSWPL
jgi:hypothetical protein